MVSATLIAKLLGMILLGWGILYVMNRKKSGGSLSFAAVLLLFAGSHEAILPLAPYPGEPEMQDFFVKASLHKGRRQLDSRQIKQPIEPKASDFLDKAQAAWDEGDFNSAFEYAHRGLASDPDKMVHSSLFVLLGSMYETVKNYHTSEDNYKMAIKIDPQISWSYVKLGNLYAKQGKLNEAELYYEQALKIDPNDAGIHNNLGHVYVQLGRFSDAESAFRAAISIDPSDPWTHNNLGALLKNMDRPSEAKSAYLNAVTLDPENILAKNGLRGL